MGCLAIASLNGKRATLFLFLFWSVAHLHFALMQKNRFVDNS